MSLTVRRDETRSFVLVFSCSSVVVLGFGFEDEDDARDIKGGSPWLVK
jgi:hypothetical protein